MSKQKKHDVITVPASPKKKRTAEQKRRFEYRGPSGERYTHHGEARVPYSKLHVRGRRYSSPPAKGDVSRLVFRPHTYRTSTGSQTKPFREPFIIKETSAVVSVLPSGEIVKKKAVKKQ